jgi:group I intron endonuclease
METELEESMVIYLITNKINGKMYVGQTRNKLKERWAAHKRCRDNMAIAKAIKKYGIEKFSIQVIDRCQTADELNKKEIDWIKHYGTLYPSGYNLQEGGLNLDNKFRSREDVNNLLFIDDDKINPKYKRFADKNQVRFINANTTGDFLHFVCSKCFNNAKIHIDALLKPYNCKKCLSKSIVRKNAWTLDKIREFISSKNLSLVSEIYSRQDDYLDFTCSLGHEFSSRWNNVRRSILRYNSTCPTCALENKGRKSNSYG